MTFYIFNNGLMKEEGVSGSDRRAMEWTKIFLRKKVLINMYTSIYGEKRYSKYGSGLKLNIIKDQNLISNTFFVYFYRAFKTAINLEPAKKGDIFYSTSDLIADSIPALIGKLKFPGTKWLTGLHLIAPNPFKDYQNVFVKGFTFPSLRGIYYYLSQKLILLFAKRKADLIMVSNSLDRENLIKRGFRADQVIITYGSVDWPTIEKVTEQPVVYDAAFIGRFHPQKGLDDLLKAWKVVCQKKPDVKMAMMGELEPILAKIREMKLEKNIDFLGFIDGLRKFELLKQSKIFLFPSTYESFGMVACEAMACHLPVIAYDLPIYKDIYHQGMVKVEIGDYKQFAQQILFLLENERERKSLGLQAFKVVKNFSWERTAKEILSSLKINVKSN